MQLAGPTAPQFYPFDGSGVTERHSIRQFRSGSVLERMKPLRSGRGCRPDRPAQRHALLRQVRRSLRSPR